MNDQAISTLQSIAARQRSAKINMALAKLYHQSGMERSAVTFYKEVLRVSGFFFSMTKKNEFLREVVFQECPMALEASEGLLKLGVKSTEVNSLVMSSPQLSSIEW